MTEQFSRESSYDTIEFVEADLSGQSAEGSRFLECRLVGCTFDDAVLDNCRLIDTGLEAVNATSLSARGSVWRDSRVDGGRVGGFVVHDATWTRVEVAGCKLDYVNLRAAELDDVTFRDCSIAELDLTSASARNVRFPGSTIEVVRLHDTGLDAVDFSDADLHLVEGIDGLRGAVVSETQLQQLAPALADHLGIKVKA